MTPNAAWGGEGRYFLGSQGYRARWVGWPSGLGLLASLGGDGAVPQTPEVHPCQECPCSVMVVDGGGIGREGCVMDNPD